jgi:hypothetical protein
LEVKIWRIAAQGQPGQKVHETPSQPIKKLVAVACVCHPCNMGNINRKTSFQARLSTKAAFEK